ncbi:MAG: DUF4430 domain-containing protein [Oscillospiraceae bacterium]|nr:DUF4430 domain-containing protein [Oscillospiraceae bacterium]
MIEIIKKHKIKIIVAVAIAAVLAVAWAYDGMLNPSTPSLAEAEIYVPYDEYADYYEENDYYNEIIEHDENPIEAADATAPTEQAPITQPYVREPVEPENMTIGDSSFTVTLSVRVDTLLNNMNRLNSDSHELVPANGVIFPATVVTVHEGESVFNVLQREMRRVGIHMSSRFTPVFNSAYVEAIGNIFHLDAGPLSGWMYRVNGNFPNFGASRYLLEPGDVIEWVYTVDLGRDVGNYFGGWQRDE